MRQRTRTSNGVAVLIVVYCPLCQTRAEACINPQSSPFPAKIALFGPYVNVNYAHIPLHALAEIAPCSGDTLAIVATSEHPVSIQ
jgi:hypothetical protein